MTPRSFTYEGFETKTVQPVEAFDAPTEIIPLIPQVMRPVFSAEEIELAKTLAREEGLREGQEAAKARYEEEKNASAAMEAVAAKQIMEEINAKLNLMYEEGQNNRNRFNDRLGQLALVIARKVCGDVAPEIIEKQITAIINESIAQLDADDKIKIHLNSKNAAYINDKFTNAVVNIDDKLDLSDFRLEWQNGFAERDVKKLWAAIGEICARQSSLEENDGSGDRSFAGAQDDAGGVAQNDVILSASEGSSSNNINKGE